MRMKHYHLYIHDIRHPLSEDGKLLCKLQTLVAITSISPDLSRASKDMAAQYKASFWGGQLLLLVDGKLSSELL